MLNFVWTYRDMVECIGDIVLVGLLVVLCVVYGILWIIEKIRSRKER